MFLCFELKQQLLIVLVLTFRWVSTPQRKTFLGFHSIRRKWLCLGLHRQTFKANLACSCVTNSVNTFQVKLSKSEQHNIPLGKLSLNKLAYHSLGLVVLRSVHSHIGRTVWDLWSFLRMMNEGAKSKTWVLKSSSSCSEENEWETSEVLTQWIHSQHAIVYHTAWPITWSPGSNWCLFGGKATSASKMEKHVHLSICLSLVPSSSYDTSSNRASVP